MKNSGENILDYSSKIEEIRKRKKTGRNPKKNATRFTEAGVKTVLGAGIGVLAGVGATILATSLLEVIVPSLLITKTAGVVGGATGLIKGINDAHKVD